MSHGHPHGHCSDHAHEHEDLERGTMFSLYTKIHIDRVECLNEVTEGSGKEVFKAWKNRLNFEKFVESDDDEELLFNIPFTGNVKLKGIVVIGGEDDTHPAAMKLYKNRPHMTFDEASLQADQEFEMQPDRTGDIDYHVKVAKFNSVYHLSIHFPRNFGAESTKIYYIGLRGEFTQVQRDGIVITAYEARANPADHKTNLLDSVQHHVR